MAKPPNYTVGARRSSRMSYVCYKIKKNISNSKKQKKTDLVHIDYRFPSHLDTEVDLILALVTVHKLVEAVLGNH